MKRALMVSLVLALSASAGFALTGGTAPLGFGAKYAAMGGAGSAIVDDITAAYYNPAGIVGGSHTELKLGAQAATDGLDKLISAIAGVSDPAKYMSDNYANNIDVNGGLNAIVGLQLADIGLSVMPVSTFSLTKPANSLAGTMAGAANYDIALTLGTSYVIPGLPIARLDLGANLKSANMTNVANIISGLSGSGTVTTRNGIGFDLGAKAQLENLPIPLSVAIVLKDKRFSLPAS